MLEKILNSFSSIFVKNEENQIIKIAEFLEEHHFKYDYQIVSDDTTWIKCFPSGEEFDLDFHITVKNKTQYHILISLYQNKQSTYNEHCEVFDDLIKYDLILKILKARTLDHLYFNTQSWDYDFKDFDYIYNYFWFDKKFRIFNSFTSENGDVQLCAYKNGFCYEVTVHKDGEVWLIIDDYANKEETDYEKYELTMDSILKELEFYFEQQNY